MAGANAGTAALHLDDISMSFAGNVVLDHVTVTVGRGEILGIVGHNGAGKSTLMKIALGVHKPVSGAVHVGGEPLDPPSPSIARGLGLGMVMQERSLIPTLSGLDNLFLGAERSRSAVRLIDRRQQLLEADALCHDLGIDPVLLRMPVKEMTAVQQQMLEIAKAVRLARTVLVLDEPTAPLSHREIDALFEVVRRTAALGVGIVLITHHLSEVFGLCDRIVCLRSGQVVLDRPTADATLQELISAMLGREAEALAQVDASSHAQPEGPPFLSVHDLQVEHKFETGNGLTFEVGRGEILGIAGLVGSGRTTLLRTIFGDLQPSTGEMRLGGERYAPRSTEDAIRAGVYLIPESRGRHGLILVHSLERNITLPILKHLRRLLLLDKKRSTDRARQMMSRLDVRAVGPGQLAGELSGGNQQKVVLAKAFAAEADLLLLDEPTFGVDIGAAAEVVRVVKARVDAGAAAIWSTSDLTELLAVSDRVLILVNGEIAQVVSRGSEQFNEATIIELMQRTPVVA